LGDRALRPRFVPVVQARAIAAPAWCLASILPRLRPLWGIWRRRDLRPLRPPPGIVLPPPLLGTRTATVAPATVRWPERHATLGTGGALVGGPGPPAPARHGAEAPLPPVGGALPRARAKRCPAPVAGFGRRVPVWGHGCTSWPLGVGGLFRAHRRPPVQPYTGGSVPHSRASWRWPAPPGQAESPRRGCRASSELVRRARRGWPWHASRSLLS
jgi:hypothetical protein